MASVEINVHVGQSAFGYEWDPRYEYFGPEYSDQARQALKKLEEGYNRIRASIIANMPTETENPKPVDDRPEVEHR